MKILVRLGVAVVAVAVAAFITYNWMLGGFDKAQAAIDIGEEMPDFTMTCTGGEEHKLSDYRGKIVVLNFASQYCPFSHAETGADTKISNLAKAHKEDGVVVLSIDSHYDTPMDKLKEYMDEHELHFVLLKDENNEYADKVEAKRTPEMFVIDREGRLRYHGAFDNSRGAGEASENYTVDAVKALLNDQDPPVTQKAAWGCTIKRAS